MKRISLAAAAVTALATAMLTACGSAPLGTSNSGSSGTPMVFSSARSPRTIANCMRAHLSSVNERAGAGYTELDIGRSSNGYAWLVTLTSTGSGSNVRVEKAVEDDSVSEPELRFAIARCTT
ncbi:sugar ABC transporter ATPase [Trinickia dinghuensis]|nr:sugar ABC transporter ATPase [Trinickia dinghuensis]